VIHLALEVLAFIFLASLGLAVLAGITGILRAIGGALSKTPAPAPKPQAHSKTRFALGHDPIEQNHDPNACPICTEDEVGHEREKLKGEIKHIPGAPWGDPSSYVWASTPVELEQARDDLQKREMQRRESETQAALEQERKKRDDEKREQETRDFLNREAARVIKEREEGEEQRKRKGRESAHEQVTSAPLIVVRPPSNEAKDEVCKCGYPGCLGHELIDNHAIFPGYTSEAAMSQSLHQIICFNVEVQGVAGNHSDGAVPASAIRIRRESQR
jgi:hypothetical protein